MVLSRRHAVFTALLVGALYVISRQPPSYDAPVSAVLIALYQVGSRSSATASAGVAVAGVAASWWLHGQAIAQEHLPAALSTRVIPATPIAVDYIVRLRTELSRRREQQVAERKAGALPASCTT